MNIADFRLQTGVPTANVTGTVGLFANASGSLITKNAAGVQTWVGGQVTGTIASTTGVVTGSLLGGSVAGWIPIVGVNGAKWVIPAYVYN